MSTFNAGAIEASLTLGRTSWTADLKRTWEEIDKLEAKTITVGLDADDTNARIVMDNLELMLDDLDQQTYTPELDLDTAPAEAALARMEASLGAIDSKDFMISVDADTDNAWVKLDTLETFLVSMDTNDINIKVNIDSAEAEIKLIGLAQFMQALSMNDINVNTDVTGYIDTMSKLAALEAQIAAVDHNNIDVKVNYDRDNLQQLIGSGAGAGATGGGQLGILELVMILIIGLAPILGVAIGAATAAVVGFVAALVAAAGPLVVLGAGLYYLYTTFAKARKAGGPLTQNMQVLADAIDHFKKVVAGLPDFSKVGFGLMAHGLNLLSDILPTLVPLFKLTANVVNDMLTSIDNWIKSPGYKGFLNFFSGFGIQMLKRFIQIIGNLLSFLGGLFVAFEPFTRIMMKGLAGATKSWADWSHGLEHNQGFQHFIQNALKYGPLLLHMLTEMWKAFQNLFHSLEPFAGPFIAVLTNFFTFIANMDPHQLGLLVILFSGLFLAMKTVVPLVSGLIGGFEALATGLGFVATVLGISVGALLIWVAAIAAVAAVLIYLWETNKKFRDNIIATWNDIKKAVMPIVHDIAKLIMDNWGSIKDWAASVWKQIEGTVVAAMVIIHQVIFFATQLIMFIWKHFGDIIIKTIIGVAKGVGDIIKGLFQVLRGIFQLIADVLTGKWSHIGKDLELIGRGTVNVIIGLFKVWSSALSGIMGVIGRALGMLWQRMWGNLKKQTSEGWGWVTGKFMDFVHWLSGIGDKINNAVYGMWDGIKNGFRSMLNTIIGWWNSLSFHIPGFDPPGPGPKFGGFTVSVPQIPQFADGAWVDKPTMAMIGEGSEPEIVSPESKMRKIFSEANHFDYTKMAAALTLALRPIFGSLLTPDVVERLLRKAAPHVAVDASNDDKSAHALAHEMAFQLRVLGYGGAA